MPNTLSHFADQDVTDSIHVRCQMTAKYSVQANAVFNGGLEGCDPLCNSLVISIIGT